MKHWVSFLLWEGIPFLLIGFFLSGIGLINWDYEKKLLVPDPSGSGWAQVHLGQVMLGISAAMALVATLLLFLTRLAFRSDQPSARDAWLKMIPLMLILIFLILPSLFIVILGPASITMMQQMRTVPHVSQ